MLAAGQQPVVLCAPQFRLAFRRFFETTFADLTVLSYAEVPSRVEIQNAGIIPCPINSWNRSSFTAASAEEAVAQIRETLGPEAVVLNVRPLPPNGLARFWQKPMIEVLACKPEAPAPAVAADPLAETLAQFRQQLAEIKEQVGSRPAPEMAAAPLAAEEEMDAELNSNGWRVGAVLRRSGLQPLHAQHILDKLQEQHGEIPPPSLGEEIRYTQDVLAASWRRPRWRRNRFMCWSARPAAARPLTCANG